MPHIKSAILSRSIEEDQQVVIQQWGKTFKHNPPNHVAINMAKLLFAVVAEGDFKTSSSMTGVRALVAPTVKLTTADYLSHASRIIIDYCELSADNLLELMGYFPLPAQESHVFSRSATHALKRISPDKIEELKGIYYGAAGQLPAYFKEPRDFGVNIAMGGTGQTNLYGKMITANGYSGHMYFHHDKASQALMLGLEQSAPQQVTVPSVGVALSALFRRGADSPEAQKEDEQHQYGEDQFGQGHSIVGASDTYTAAGSLYFSDPIYQAKLLIEKGCFPPDKYDGMHVKLNNINWPTIKAYIERLNANILAPEMTALLEQIGTPPSTSNDYGLIVPSYIDLEFKDYLKRAFQELIANKPLPTLDKANLQKLQVALLTAINELKRGTMASYPTFIGLINAITGTTDLPEDYKNLILRIKTLFQLQLERSVNLKEAHLNLEAQNRHEALQAEVNSLLSKSLLMQQYYQSESSAHEACPTTAYLHQLDELVEELHRIKGADTSSITKDYFEEKRQYILDAHSLLSKTPYSYSQAALKELDSQVTEINLENLELKEHEQLQTGTIQALKLSNEKLTFELEAVKTQKYLIKTASELSLKRLHLVSPLYSNINEIRANAALLKHKKCDKAHDVAILLANELQTEIDMFINGFDGDDADALLAFKNRCVTHLNTARPALEFHNDWKTILANALLAISLLFVGYAIAVVINKSQTGQFGFFKNPSSAKAIGGLVVNINSLKDDVNTPSSIPIIVSA